MIHLQPLGETNFDLQWLAKELEKKFEKATIVNPKIEIPISCFNRRRGQFNSTCIITFFKTEVVTLFITEKDIYADDMNFVFGEAEIGGKRAIISINRLKSQDENLFRQRVLKEAIHELGHVFGLIHCKNKGCVMNFSSNVFEVDKKTQNFCFNCLKKLKRDPI